MPSQSSAEGSGAGWNFDNSYASLPDALYVRMDPVPVRAPRLVLFNRELCESLGLDARTLDTDVGASIFSGNLLPKGAQPMAQAYAGHQFGSFTMLGDGRAILLGEQITPQGERFDIQLKGSGQTPFSRRGDGRAALGPMLREYLISEAMHGLGIPTTRSLAVVATGEMVQRETTLPGAILTRVAASHIRVGTFEYLSARGDHEGLLALADHVLARHFPALKDYAHPYLGLLQAVMQRQASLVAKWLQVGFIHGVMNTDNMSLCGETIDYGPCAFMDAYDPDTVFSSIDQGGRYAYGNQPQMAQWNLARFGEALLPLLHEDPRKAIELAQEAIQAFPVLFRSAWLDGMRAKLGLFTREPEDLSLVKELLAAMQEGQADYTNTLRALASPAVAQAPEFQAQGLAEWLNRWQVRLTRQPESLDMGRSLIRAQSPALIPRNHLVEEVLEAATRHGDYAPLERLLTVLSRPYEERPEDAPYRQPPGPSVQPYQTFCGT
ncbi:MAG: YdiU family protein [Humidesulfovibrio sp.]|uniref:protein adenylyltransferase SelO n=1 Tax=Humidesulfovibrio sp. TaxID=2910988 RepID=UPI0027ED2D12|nr:YdiU family protein [Humidesulfovibrio sp.]MDQ7835014.1 YdiU family protein [Humidesulfovibrio sp.]